MCFVGETDVGGRGSCDAFVSAVAFPTQSCHRTKLTPVRRNWVIGQWNQLTCGIHELCVVEWKTVTHDGTDDVWKGLRMFERLWREIGKEEVRRADQSGKSGESKVWNLWRCGSGYSGISLFSVVRYLGQKLALVGLCNLLGGGWGSFSSLSCHSTESLAHRF
jgi:hypothetical protein